MNIAIIGSGEMAFGIARNIIEKRKNDHLIIYSKDKNVKVRFFQSIPYKEKELNDISIVFTSELKDLLKTDLIIESTHEIFEIKYEIFSKLGKMNFNGPILSNTSTLDLEKIVERLQKPNNIFGAHFFNPAYRTKSLEISKFRDSSEFLYNIALDFCKSLGKKVLEMSFVIGYSINRILAHQIHEAIRILITSNVCMNELDVTYINAVGSVNGPIKTADIIGLDVLDKIFENILGKNYDDSVKSVLKKYISQNHLGRKTKKGFYNY